MVRFLFEYEIWWHLRQDLCVLEANNGFRNAKFPRFFYADGNMVTEPLRWKAWCHDEFYRGVHGRKHQSDYSEYHGTALVIPWYLWIVKVTYSQITSLLCDRWNRGCSCLYWPARRSNVNGQTNGGTHEQTYFGF